MKILKQTFSLLTIASIALLISNCGGGGSETPVEKVQLGKLSKTWVLKTSTSATLDNNVASQIDPNFALTITGTFSSGSKAGPYSFSVTGTQTPSPWQGTGKWFFGPDPKTQLVRDENSNSTLDAVGDLGITYSINTAGELTIDFACSDGGCGYAGAKTSQVTGAWKFVLK